MKGQFELTSARGVRERSQCWDKFAWPKKVPDEHCFGVSTEKRTYYLYTETEEEARCILYNKYTCML